MAIFRLIPRVRSSLDPIRRTVAERVNVTSIEQVQIVRAELGPNAGLIGAGVWVKDQHQPG